MTYHESWQRGHREIAGKIRSKEKVLEKKSGFANELPKLSTDIHEWMEQARPIVEGKQRSFLPFPFWKEIYTDDYSFKMIVGGRQIFKSTYVTDTLACEATAIPGVQV